MAGNTVSITVKASDKASSEVDKIKNKFQTLSTSKGFQNAVMGVGIGAGVAAWGMLKGAVDMAAGALGEASAAFREDQAGQKMLAQALANNVTAWDGNTAAVEAYAGAQGRLGFSDDEVRASLEQLVGVTHEVTAAQELNTLAQELARAKNINLATAADIVTKAHEGNGKALKALGVDITGVTTAAGFLDAIQTNVAGSAETWAATNDGKLAVSNVKVGEGMESVGKIVDKFAQVILPPLAEAFVAIADFMDTTLSPAIDFVTTNFDKLAPIIGIAAAGLALYMTPAMLGYAAAATAAAAATVVAIAPFIAMAAAVAGLLALWNEIDKKAASNANKYIQLPNGEWATAGGTSTLGSAPKPSGTGALPVLPTPGLRVPGFATGGIVPGALGSPMLAVVHGGERVTPAGSAGPVTFAAGSIIVNGAQDPAATARQLMQHIRRELGRQNMSFG